ncbi:MAG: amino acid ABC transporter substrate-binding protein [Firmicutes bacterium]|nr:amino acid ABC transporter substrate-binding protein [Bacillota bacterium]
MKKLLMLFSCLMLTMGLMAGCGGDAPADKGGDDAATGWAYIQEKGELVVGLDDTFAPMGFRDAENNLVGFDIDLAVATGEVLGVDVKFQPISWDAKEMELSSKNIDCIWNGMSATAERQESMALTKKYLNNKIVIMTLDKDLAVTTVDDLQNITMATQAGSAALETMMANEAWDTFSANVTEYPTYDEALLAMQGGRVQAIVVDQVLGEYKNANMGGEMVVADYNFGDDFYAIGCRQGETDVADKINEALQTLIDNGKAAEISDKWFGTNIVILEDYE